MSWNADVAFGLMVIVSSTSAFGQIRAAEVNEVIGQIQKNDESLKTWSAHVIGTIPANKDDPKIGDERFVDVNWAFDREKQAFAGLVFESRQDGSPMLGVRRIIAFDGNQLRVFGDSTPETTNGRIAPLISPGFNPYPLPLVLIGHIFRGGMSPLGESLKRAKEVRIRGTEEVAGHRCIVLEAIAIDDTIKGADPDDAVVWIDPERGYRPLVWEVYRGWGGKNRFKVPMARCDDIELRQISGQWVPISGNRRSFTEVDAILPPGLSKEKMEAMSHEEVVQALDFPVKEYRLTKIRLVPESITVNAPIPPETFTITFPAFCGVFDEFKNEGYRVTEGPEDISHPLLGKEVKTTWNSSPPPATPGASADTSSKPATPASASGQTSNSEPGQGSAVVAQGALARNNAFMIFWGILTVALLGGIATAIYRKRRGNPS